MGNWDNDFEISRNEAIERHDALEAAWKQLETRMSGSGSEEHQERENTERYAEECETVRQVLKYDGTMQDMACTLRKMQIWPHLFRSSNSTSTYPVLLRLSANSDSRLFTIKDPRYSYKTFLHAVCAARDLQTAQFILNHGEEINATDGAGLTALMQTFIEPYINFVGAPGEPVMKGPKDISAEMIIRVARFLIGQGATLEFEYQGIPLYFQPLTESGQTGGINIQGDPVQSAPFRAASVPRQSCEFYALNSMYVLVQAVTANLATATPTWTESLLSGFGCLSVSTYENEVSPCAAT